MSEILGELQAKMLWHLAEKPDSKIQPIQKALSNYYKNVYDNIGKLKAKGYIQGKGTFRLTVKGVAYILSTTTKDKKVKALEMLNIYAKYESSISGLKVMWSLFNGLSVNTSVKLLKNVGKTLLIHGENVWQSENLQQLVVNTFLNLSNGELKELKRIIKSIPELRQQVINSVERAKDRLLEDK